MMNPVTNMDNNTAALGNPPPNPQIPAGVTVINQTARRAFAQSEIEAPPSKRQTVRKEDSLIPPSEEETISILNAFIEDPLRTLPLLINLKPRLQAFPFTPAKSLDQVLPLFEKLMWVCFPYLDPVCPAVAFFWIRNYIPYCTSPLPDTLKQRLIHCWMFLRGYQNDAAFSLLKSFCIWGSIGKWKPPLNDTEGVFATVSPLIRHLNLKEYVAIRDASPGQPILQALIPLAPPDFHPALALLAGDVAKFTEILNTLTDYEQFKQFISTFEHALPHTKLKDRDRSSLTVSLVSSRYFCLQQPFLERIYPGDSLLPQEVICACAPNFLEILCALAQKGKCFSEIKGEQAILYLFNFLYEKNRLFLTAAVVKKFATPPILAFLRQLPLSDWNSFLVAVQQQDERGMRQLLPRLSQENPDKVLNFFNHGNLPRDVALLAPLAFIHVPNPQADWWLLLISIFGALFERHSIDAVDYQNAIALICSSKNCNNPCLFLIFIYRYGKHHFLPSQAIMRLQNLAPMLKRKYRELLAAFADYRKLLPIFEASHLSKMLLADLAAHHSDYTPPATPSWEESQLVEHWEKGDFIKIYGKILHCTATLERLKTLLPEFIPEMNVDFDEEDELDMTSEVRKLHNQECLWKLLLHCQFRDFDAVDMGKLLPQIYHKKASLCAHTSYTFFTFIAAISEFTDHIFDLKYKESDFGYTPSQKLDILEIILRLLRKKRLACAPEFDFGVYFFTPRHPAETSLMLTVQAALQAAGFLRQPLLKGAIPALLHQRHNVTQAGTPLGVNDDLPV